MRIYLDACCFNRPFDDQTQTRIRLETDAILMILDKSQHQDWKFIGSEVLNYEIAQNPNPEKRRRVSALLTLVHETQELTTEIEHRAREIQGKGIKPFDSLHIASAESARVEVFLTTDDALVKGYQRFPGFFRVRIANPINWLVEVGM